MSKKISIDEAVEIAEKKKGLAGLDKAFIGDIKEKRTVTIQTVLKPSEKKAFLDLIGREAESSVVRRLILEFIKSKG